VRRPRLRHVDDDSNADPRFARNRLRRDVWPDLTAAFPHAESALADSAAWAHEAALVAADLAAIDRAAVGTDDGALTIARLAALAPHRRANLLRHWLRSCVGQPPTAALLARLGRELDPRGTQRWAVPGGELRSHRGKLRVVVTPARPDAATPERQLQITQAGRTALPGWGGTLVVRRVRSGGVPLAWLARLELRARAGGERFQAGPGRPPRSLKKQYQAAGVAQWQRGGPLIYSGGQLVFVPGLGVDARVVGLPGQALVQFEWQPDSARAAA
jgi:tRNA(Ile)-lysidine synthase